MSEHCFGIRWWFPTLRLVQPSSHRAWGSRCSSVHDETVICPIDLWEAMMAGFSNSTSPLNWLRLLVIGFRLWNWSMLEMQVWNEMIMLKLLWAVDHSARKSMKSAAKRDNYCELQDILSSNNLNANSGFGYSWNHVRLRVDKSTRKCNITDIVYMPVENWVRDRSVYEWLLPQVDWNKIFIHIYQTTNSCDRSCHGVVVANLIRHHDLRRARLPAEFKHITKRRKRK